MKLTALALILFGVQASATAYSQSTKISLELKNQSIKEALYLIESKTEFKFIYESGRVNLNKTVSLRVKDQTVEAILDKLLKGENVSYEITESKLIMIYPTEKAVKTEPATAEATQQKRIVTGTVVDNLGEAVIGANVIEKGATMNGTVTNLDGQFTLSVSPNAILQISYIGYATREIAVGNQTDIRIILNEDAQALEEVVVVGYGTQKKVNLTGAVQAVSSKAIENRPVTNVNQALQGLAANVNISQETGRANSAPEINIRGFTSINGGSALILVDNVPVSPDELSRINPEDIESVSVLKDAASAAIYGGRASFGVVLITTKSAKNNKLEVSADANVGFRAFAYLPQLITDPLEHMTLANPSSTRKPLFYESEFEHVRNMKANPDKYPAYRVVGENGYASGLYTTAGMWANYYEIDYNDAFLRDIAPTYTGNVRISNRNDKMAYTVSGGYFHQDGMMRYGNDLLDRFNTRVNGTYKLNDWWEVGTNTSFNYYKYNMPESGVEKYFWQISRNPMRPIYNPDGTYGYNGANIIGLAEEGGRKIDEWNQTQLSFNTKIDLIKNEWTLRADANFRFTNSMTKAEHYPVYWKAGPNIPLQPVYGDLEDGMQNVNYAYSKSNLGTYQVYNIYSDYEKTFAGKHNIHGMIGYNQEYTKGIETWIRRRELISTSLPTVQLATGLMEGGETIEDLALRGVFGRFMYSYDNKYLLEIDGRYDGTSRFPKNSRFGFFPSGSLGWVVSRESFAAPLAEAAQIDQLKLRASYGTLGNQVLKDYYPYIASMSMKTLTYPVDGALSQYVNQPGVVAGNLTWETVRTVNLAFDLVMLNNRLTLSFDKYTRYTEGMLVQSKELPHVFGADPPKENAGNLKTKGWELSVGYRDKVNLNGSPLELGITVNISDARTWITKFDNDTKSINTTRGTANYYVGQEIGELWGLTTDGYLQKSDLVLDDNGNPTGRAKIDQYQVAEDDNGRTVYEGDVKFLDLNGDGEITYGKFTVDDPGDRKIIGNESIRYPYSFTLDAAYKGFDLRAFFYGVGKCDWYPYQGFHDFWGIYANPWSSAIVANRDNWTMNGNDAYFPRLKPYAAEGESKGLELAAVQTKYLQDASYLRLKNLTIGYTLPASMTKRLHVARLRVYASAENLFTIDHLKVDGIDPELAPTIQRNGNALQSFYPMQKVYTLGLNLNF
jgi:TonB-linked SusC/RagA family outer membrane protein